MTCVGYMTCVDQTLNTYYIKTCQSWTTGSRDGFIVTHHGLPLAATPLVSIIAYLQSPCPWCQYLSHCLPPVATSLTSTPFSSCAKEAKHREDDKASKHWSQAVDQLHDHRISANSYNCHAQLNVVTSSNIQLNLFSMGTITPATCKPTHINMGLDNSHNTTELQELPLAYTAQINTLLRLIEIE